MGERKKFLKVALIWNELIIDEKTFQKPEKVIIGADPYKATFAIEDESVKLGDQFTFIEPKGDGTYTLNIADGMDGDFIIDGKEYEFKDFKNKFKKSTTIKPYDSGNIDIGELTISFAFIDEADKIITKGAHPINTVFINSLIATTIIHVALVVFMLLSRGDVDELTFTDIPDRFAKIMIEEEKEEEEDPEIEKEKKIGRKKENIGKRAGGKQGKIGNKDTPKYIKTKLPKARRELITKNLKARGVFGALGSTLHGGGMSKLVAGDGGVGNRLAASFNGTSGDEFIAGRGSGGMGFRGTGTGGGGTGYGRIGGTGDIDTGGGRGTRVSLSKGRKGERKVRVRKKGKVTYTGFCKKSDIQRVVSKKSRTIRYCYAKELQRFRSLKGKVKLRWVIGLTGKVEKVTVDQDTMKNSRLISCLKRQVKRWKFTKPEGGKCIIAYPFLFTPE